VVSSEAQEAGLYPTVERWMKKHFGCFKGKINVGLKYSRVDVLGVRDTGGDVTGEIEIIAIEVKRHGGVFATSSGQALRYRVYATRFILLLLPTPVKSCNQEYTDPLNCNLLFARSWDEQLDYSFIPAILDGQSRASSLKAVDS
jgi:hypothetical protein